MGGRREGNDPHGATCVWVCARTESSGRDWCQHVDAAAIALDQAYLHTFSQDAELKTKKKKCDKELQLPNLDLFMYSFSFF